MRPGLLIPTFKVGDYVVRRQEPADTHYDAASVPEELVLYEVIDADLDGEVKVRQIGQGRRNDTWFPPMALRHFWLQRGMRLGDREIWGTERRTERWALADIVLRKEDLMCRPMRGGQVNGGVPLSQKEYHLRAMRNAEFAPDEALEGIEYEEEPEEL